MFRLLIALNLLLLNLEACEGGYDSCMQKIIDSDSIIRHNLQIPVTKNTRLLFGKTTPNAKIIKFDPFLNLYIVKAKKKFDYPFRVNYFLSPGSAIVTDFSSQEGKVVKEQVGLNRFGVYNETIFFSGLLTNSCCALEGLAVSEGIIQREYIQKFLETKEVFYGDIGIRVSDSVSPVVVQSIDPFMQNNPFKPGDCIIKLDGKKVKNSASFMRNILFAKAGLQRNVTVLRDSEVMEFCLITKERFGGGYISDTYLEQFGIYFDEELSIKKIVKNSKNLGLKVGDKLIQVNDVKVFTQKDVMQNIANFKDSASLLFQRNGFQFFVRIN